MDKKPEIGTVLWSVWEHLYYIPGKAAPVLEYCVIDSTVTSFTKGKRYVEIRAIATPPDRGKTPLFFKFVEIGKRVFYTQKEAARLAKEMTDAYEKVWMRMGEEPLRRTWQRYL